MNNKTKILLVSILLPLSIFLVFIQIFGLSFEGKESDFYVEPVNKENIPAYKDSCIQFNLSSVLKDLTALQGQKVKVTGQIYQKEEYNQFYKTRTSLLLKVPELAPEPYIDVSYTGTTPFIEGDMVTVYGEYYYPSIIDIPPEGERVSFGAGGIAEVPSKQKNAKLISIKAALLEKA